MSSNLKRLVIALLVILTLLFFTQISRKKSSDSKPNADQITETLFQECHDKEASEQCYKKSLTSIAKTDTLVFAVQVLKNLQKIEPLVRSCHSLAHEMALTATELAPNDWLDVTRTIDPEECSGGFFHGALEGHASASKGEELSSNEIKKICGGLSAYQAGSCAHILGHIILVNTRGKVDEALTICDQTENKELEKQCYSGVFMENTTKEDLSAHGLAVQTNWDTNSITETEKLCQKYKQDKAFACWGQLGHMYSVVYNDDSEMVYKLCGQADDLESKTNCFLHAAEKMAVTLTDQNKINNICSPQLGDKSAINICVSHVISSMLKTSKEFMARAEAFCRSNDNYKLYCLKIIKDNAEQNQ